MIANSVFTLALLGAAAAHAADAGLHGSWVLNHDLTREEQPDGP